MENKQKEKLRKLGLTDEQVEGVQRLLENQEHFKMNEGAGDNYDDPKIPINISLKEPHPYAPEKFLGIDMNYLQEVYEEIKPLVEYEMCDSVTRNKIKTLMEASMPYYQIKCNEENNPPEVVDNGQVWVRVTDPKTNNYADLVF